MRVVHVLFGVVEAVIDIGLGFGLQIELGTSVSQSVACHVRGSKVQQLNVVADALSPTRYVFQVLFRFLASGCRRWLAMVVVPCLGASRLGHRIDSSVR